jgi:hypothetical protein
MSITISFTHSGSTTTHTVPLGDTARMNGFMASHPDGIEGYLAGLVAGLVNQANSWAAQQAAQQAATGTPEVLPPWAPDLWMATGSRWRHNSQTWVVVQAHRSQADWQPQSVPALFALVPGSGPGTPEWAAGVQYSTIGQLVTHSGITYRLLQAHTSQVGWEPSNVPSLWAVN